MEASKIRPPLGSALAQVAGGPGWGWALALLMFCLPLWYNMQSVALGVLVFSWLVHGIATRFRALRTAPGHYRYWLLLFGIYSISALLSHNSGAALADWGRKLGMPLMALAIGAGPHLTAGMRQRAFTALVLGNVVAMIVCPLYAFFYDQPAGMAGYFNDELVHALDYNAAYASLHVIPALACLALSPSHNVPRLQGTKARWLLAFLLFIFLLFLGSKLLVLVGGAIMAGGIWMERRDGRFLRRSLPLAGALVGVLLLFFWVSGPLLIDRYKITVQGVQEGPAQQANDIAAADNFSKRAVVWTAAGQILARQQPWLLGIGSGDFEEAMTARITSPDFTYKSYTGFEQLKGMNAHNMYLQSLVAAGLPALLCLLLMVGTAIVFALRGHYLVGLVCWGVFAVFMLQESALQTQAGLFPICCVGLVCARVGDWGMWRRRLNR